jgi:hypothetical protein
MHTITTNGIKIGSVSLKQGTDDCWTGHLKTDEEYESFRELITRYSALSCNVRARGEKRIELAELRQAFEALSLKLWNHGEHVACESIEITDLSPTYNVPLPIVVTVVFGAAGPEKPIPWYLKK